MPRATIEVTRALAVLRVKRKLLANSSPHAQMALIVALTGAMGLLGSFTLLQLGLGSMAARYPLAVGLAYLCFLFFVWLWLRTNAEDYVDVPGPALDLPMPGPARGAPEFGSGGGGDFAGGGASATFDAPATALEEGAAAPLRSTGDAVGAVAEADELAIPLLAVALAIGLAFASLYVIYIAPVLFAEVLVDGALSYALFRHLRGQDPQHWLLSAMRRTVGPFLATALFLALVGAAMSAYAPGAKSIGQVVARAGATPP